MNLYQSFFTLFLVLFLFSCSQKKVYLTIDEDEFVFILLDTYLAEGALQPIFSNQKDSLAQIYYEQIFEIHSISKETFLENIQILRENPTYSKEIYKKVLKMQQEKKEKIIKK